MQRNLKRRKEYDYCISYSEPNSEIYVSWFHWKQARIQLSHTQRRNVETPADIRLGCVRGGTGAEVDIGRAMRNAYVLQTSDSYLSRHAHYR